MDNNFRIDIDHSQWFSKTYLRIKDSKNNEVAKMRFYHNDSYLFNLWRSIGSAKEINVGGEKKWVNKSDYEALIKTENAGDQIQRIKSLVQGKMPHPGGPGPGSTTPEVPSEPIQADLKSAEATTESQEKEVRSPTMPSISINTAVKVDSVFDRKALAAAYAEQHRSEPLKAKPLKIIYENTEVGRAKVKGVLKNWQTLCMTNIDEYTKKEADCKTGDEIKALMNEEAKFETAKSISQQAEWLLNGEIVSRDGIVTINPNELHVATVVDDKGTIQAISVGKLDPQTGKMKIEFLVTAPHNLRASINRDNPNRVEGAGTALIEDAIFRSFQQLQDKAEVKLISDARSVDFYQKMGFEKDEELADNPFARVLKGENLTNFLKKYGGRAATA